MIPAHLIVVSRPLGLLQHQIASPNWVPVPGLRVPIYIVLLNLVATVGTTAVGS